RVTRDERDGIGVVHRFTRAKPRAAVFAGKFETRYEDDALGFTRITTPDGRVHRFRALPGGSIERIHGDGSHEVSHYDGQGRCTGRYVWRDGQEEALWYARYRYSRAGDLQTIEDRFRGTTHFAYDAA